MVHCCSCVAAGLHYDALAVGAFDGAPEELDVTILQPESADGAAAAQGAAKLVSDAAARYCSPAGSFDVLELSAAAAEPQSR